MIFILRDYGLLRLHKTYNIASTPNKKLDYQYMRLFRVMEKVGLLMY